MRCENCGTDIPEKAHFCRICGTPVDRDKIEDEIVNESEITAEERHKIELTDNIDIRKIALIKEEAEALTKKASRFGLQNTSDEKNQYTQNFDVNVLPGSTDEVSLGTESSKRVADILKEMTDDVPKEEREQDVKISDNNNAVLTSYLSGQNDSSEPEKSNLFAVADLLKPDETIFPKDDKVVLESDSDLVLNESDEERSSLDENKDDYASNSEIVINDSNSEIENSNVKLPNDEGNADFSDLEESAAKEGEVKGKDDTDSSVESKEKDDSLVPKSAELSIELNETSEVDENNISDSPEASGMVLEKKEDTSNDVTQKEPLIELNNIGMKSTKDVDFDDSSNASSCADEQQLSKIEIDDDKDVKNSDKEIKIEDASENVKDEVPVSDDELSTNIFKDPEKEELKINSKDINPRNQEKKSNRFKNDNKKNTNIIQIIVLVILLLASIAWLIYYWLLNNDNVKKINKLEASKEELNVKINSLENELKSKQDEKSIIIINGYRMSLSNYSVYNNSVITNIGNYNVKISIGLNQKYATLSTAKSRSALENNYAKLGYKVSQGIQSVENVNYIVYNLVDNKGNNQLVVYTALTDQDSIGFVVSSNQPVSYDILKSLNQIVATTKKDSNYSVSGVTAFAN